MLEEFLTWAREREMRSAHHGPAIVLTVAARTSNPSARLDVDGNNSIGRITVWDDGNIDIEVLDVVSGDGLYAAQISASAPYKFDELFSPFFVQIAEN